MKWMLVMGAGLVVVVAGAAALTVGSPSTHEVAGDHFAVPKERLVEDRIPWLPAPEPDAFTFRLELDRPFDREHDVLVQPATHVCGSDRMSQLVRVACGVEKTRLEVGAPYTKVYPHPDYRSAWDYYTVRRSAAGGRPERLQVASCSPISPNPARPKGTAICTSVWGVDGLVLSLVFEEHELAELPSMKARATQMLLSWKVR
jgi:hypothetical protein